MSELITYPYRAGEAGIPIHELPQNTTGEIAGGSGRLLRYALSPNEIEFIDKLDQRFFLIAKVLRDTLILDIRARVKYGFFRRELKPHPDFFPVYFVDYALHHFGQNGISPELSRGVWVEPRDNQPADDYESFMKVYYEGFDLKKAANSTYTAQLLRPHGFSVWDSKEVNIHRHKVGEFTWVEALFKRS